MQRFLDQCKNRIRREYKQGRLSAEDEGTLAFAITADKEKGKIIIDFSKPVTWLGMDVKDVVALAEMLISKARTIATEPFSVNL